jgi:predicted nucleic acid-binding protein
MPIGTRLRLCLDSNVFLAVLLPEATKASQDDIRGAERVVRALERGEISVVTSVMALAEIRWVFAREDKPGFDVARATLEGGFHNHLTILPVDGDLAVASAVHRRRYYSKANPFSYNDGIFLATGIRAGATALLTTDPHLLQVVEIPAHRPANFPAVLRQPRRSM